MRNDLRRRLAGSFHASRLDSSPRNVAEYVDALRPRPNGRRTPLPITVHGGHTYGETAGVCQVSLRAGACDFPGPARSGSVVVAGTVLDGC